jgi:hypothetical protein
MPTFRSTLSVPSTQVSRYTSYLLAYEEGTDSLPKLWQLTLSLLMSYIYTQVYMELLVKPEILTLYIYEPTFGNAKSRLFVFAAQCFNTESMQKVILWHSCV